jgi:hypothetical protein
VDLATAAVSATTTNSYLHVAADAYLRALVSTNGECFVRVRSGMKAGLILYSQGHWGISYFNSSTTTELFSTLINRQLSMVDQQEQLKGVTEVSCLAASAALKLGKSPLEALKIMESGRGIIVNEMLSLQEDYSELKDSNPDLYQQYSELQQTLLRLNQFGNESPLALQIQISSQRADTSYKLQTLRKRIQDLPGLRAISHLLTNSDLERVSS